MKKFSFALEPVLDQRERVEDEKQQILAMRMLELKAAQEELRRLNAEFKRFSAALRGEHEKLDGHELRSHYAHLEYLDRCMVMQHAKISSYKAAVERARLDLTQASKDRKVIEKLKDKRYEEHRAMEAAFEQKELDDSNARRHSRAALHRGGLS